MKREFDLSETGLAYFTELCGREGLPNSSIVRGQENRYSTIETRIEYPDLDNMIFSLEYDDSQKLRQLWDPKGVLLPHKTAEMLRMNPEQYLSGLKRQQPRPRRIVAKLASERAKEDAFTFDFDRGLWILRYFRIARQNFELYKLNGMDLGGAKSVLGIYSTQ